jgi:hypothetical protein
VAMQVTQATLQLVKKVKIEELLEIQNVSKCCFLYGMEWLWQASGICLSCFELCYYLDITISKHFPYRCSL